LLNCVAAGEKLRLDREGIVGMHVLVTADAVGGVWTYARELVTGLSRKGVQVTLVSFGDIPSVPQIEWLEGLRGVDFLPTAFRLEWMQDAENDIEASSDYLRRVIDEVQPDILHLNQFCYGSLKVDIPKLVVAHSDVVSWWVNVKGSEPPVDRWTAWYRDVVGRGLAEATGVVAPSRWMMDCVESIYGKPTQGCVIYNGRTPTLFNPFVTKEDSVLSVGRLWDGGKQAALLTQIATKVPVYIAGTEEHADESFRSAESSLGKSHPQLFLKGPQSEAQLRQLFGKASMYVATSRYEPFGLAPVEAALSRCALICNDIPTFRELWGDAAIYFKRNDAEDLQAAIEQLHADREMRLTFANLAYNRARQRFTAERMVDEYLNLYQALVTAEAAAA
jgi:glycosyltransferase involved in cell wall biosynthesis